MNRYTLPTLVLSALVAAPSAAAVPSVPTETLTLDRALENTHANLPALRQARAQVEQARGLYDQARAGWYPTVSIALAYKRTTGNIAVSPGLTPAGEALPAANLNTYNYFTNSVVASQLLWDFGQTSNKVASTVEIAHSQQEAARTALLQAELAVRAAFFVAAAQNDLVRVAEANLANNDAHLAETVAFVKEGTQPEIALATAEANRANAVVQMITAKNAYATAHGNRWWPRFRPGTPRTPSFDWPTVATRWESATPSRSAMRSSPPTRQGLRRFRHSSIWTRRGPNSSKPWEGPKLWPN